MAIPRMTPEDIRLENDYKLRLMLSRVPYNKRWLVSLALDYVLAHQGISEFLKHLEMKRHAFMARVRHWLHGVFSVICDNKKDGIP